VKLSDYVLEELAEMVVGDAKHFPYRSSYYITRFFESIDLPYKHDNSQTRRFWAKDRLIELNGGPARSPDLPSDDLCKVICRLFEPDDFARANKGLELPVRVEVRRADVNLALESFNEVVKRHRRPARQEWNGLSEKHWHWRKHRRVFTEDAASITAREGAKRETGEVPRRGKRG
jgi:hypothetical protein